MAVEDEIIQLLESIRYGDQLSKRLFIWMQTLEKLVNYLEMTSGYICRHDFRRRITINVCQYVSSQSGIHESKSHPGETFFESQFPKTLAWLQSGNPDPRIIHMDEMTTDDPELQEYLDNHVLTALMLKLFSAEGIWGYIELWDTQCRREFDASMLEAAQKVARGISRSIPT